MRASDEVTDRRRLARSVRAHLHRAIGVWRIDRAERDQLRGLAELWDGSGRPLLLALALVALTISIDALLPAGLLGDRTPGPDVSQAVLEVFGGVLGLLGVATLAAAVSLAVVQSAAERYRRYVVDQLADDPARDAFLSLLFIAFTVTISDLVLVTAGFLRPAVGLAAPVVLAVLAFALLTQYVRRRIRWLKPSEIVRHLAVEVGRQEKAMLTPATAMVAGPALSRRHREAARGLLRLLSLCLDGLAEGEPATIDDAVAAYRAYIGVVTAHARARLATSGPLAAVLTPRAPTAPERLSTLRDERLLRAILADSHSRTGPGRPGRPGEDAALWFEQLALAAAPAPLLAVLGNGRGRDDEFAEDWCEQLSALFSTTREHGDLAMGKSVLAMLETLPGALSRLAADKAEIPLPAAVVDSVTEAAAAVARTLPPQSIAWNVREELRTSFLDDARRVYLSLLPSLEEGERDHQHALARNPRSRLASLGWLQVAEAGPEPAG